MLQTRSFEMCRSSGNNIQWRISLFDTVLVYKNENRPLLRLKFGSVYNFILYRLNYFIVEVSRSFTARCVKEVSGYVQRSSY